MGDFLYNLSIDKVFFKKEMQENYAIFTVNLKKRYPLKIHFLHIIKKVDILIFFYKKKKIDDNKFQNRLSVFLKGVNITFQHSTDKHVLYIKAIKDLKNKSILN